MWKLFGNKHKCIHHFRVLRTERYKSIFNADGPMTRIYEKCTLCGKLHMSIKEGWWYASDFTPWFSSHTL